MGLHRTGWDLADLPDGVEARDPSKMADDALSGMQTEDGRAAAGADPLRVLEGGVG